MRVVVVVLAVLGRAMWSSPLTGRLAAERSDGCLPYGECVAIMDKEGVMAVSEALSVLPIDCGALAVLAEPLSIRGTARYFPGGRK